MHTAYYRITGDEQLAACRHLAEQKEQAREARKAFAEHHGAIGRKERGGRLTALLFSHGRVPKGWRPINFYADKTVACKPNPRTNAGKAAKSCLDTQEWAGRRLSDPSQNGALRELGVDQSDCVIDERATAIGWPVISHITLPDEAFLLCVPYAPGSEKPQPVGAQEIPYSEYVRYFERHNAEVERRKTEANATHTESDQ